VNCRTVEDTQQSRELILVREKTQLWDKYPALDQSLTRILSSLFSAQSDSYSSSSSGWRDGWKVCVGRRKIKPKVFLFQFISPFLNLQKEDFFELSKLVYYRVRERGVSTGGTGEEEEEGPMP
jgi:hypothetical protein